MYQCHDGCMAPEGKSGQDGQSHYFTLSFCEINTKLQKKKIVGVHKIVNSYKILTKVVDRPSDENCLPQSQKCRII